MNGSLYWTFHQSCIRLQIGAGICAVPTADAVVTGEVSCYNCIVRLRSVPNCREAISQGNVAQPPLACEDGEGPYMSFEIVYRGLLKIWRKVNVRNSGIPSRNQTFKQERKEQYTITGTNRHLHRYFSKERKTKYSAKRNVPFLVYTLSVSFS